MRKLIVLALCASLGGCYWTAKKTGKSGDNPPTGLGTYEPKRL